MLLATSDDRSYKGWTREESTWHQCVTKGSPSVAAVTGRVHKTVRKRHLSALQLRWCVACFCCSSTHWVCLLATSHTSCLTRRGKQVSNDV
jgi:hypothetical protein